MKKIFLFALTSIVSYLSLADCDNCSTASCIGVAVKYIIKSNGDTYYQSRSGTMEID